MQSADAKRGTRKGSPSFAGSPSSPRSMARRTPGAACGSWTCASLRPGARGYLFSSAPAATSRVRPGARTSARRAEIFPDKAEHRVVPGDDVARPEDPVVLVGKDDQLARHLVVLQRLEEVQALVHRAAIVLFAVDHEARRLHFAAVARRRVAVEALRVLVRVLTAHLEVPPRWVIRGAGELRHREH